MVLSREMRQYARSTGKVSLSLTNMPRMCIGKWRFWFLIQHVYFWNELETVHLSAGILFLVNGQLNFPQRCPYHTRFCRLQWHPDRSSEPQPRALLQIRIIQAAAVKIGDLSGAESKFQTASLLVRT
jgi:hypothetical protein